MFRILSLDGGGILETFTASALASIEEDTGRPIAAHFGFITGTSTGGILAIGLAFGLSPKEMLDFYITCGPAIFPAIGRMARTRRFVRQLFGTKFSHEPLTTALKDVLGDRRFGDASQRLVIPSYNAVSDRIYLFKTPHHPDLIKDASVPAFEVARATSAAPTYFAAARRGALFGAQFVDGGVWANNPALVGLVEAAAFLDQAPADVDILSIGTTSAPFSIAEHASSGALIWNAGLIALMMNAQGESHRAMASLLAGGLHQNDHVARPRDYSMDDARPKTIEKTVDVGRCEAQKRVNREAVTARLVNGVLAAPFVAANSGGAE